MNDVNDTLSLVEKLELAVLSALSTRESVEEAKEVGLEATHFTNPAYRGYYDYLVGLYEQGRKIPSYNDKKELWHLPELPADHVDVHSLATEILRLDTARRAKDVLSRNLRTMDSDPSSAIATMMDELARLSPVTHSENYYESGAISRIQEMEKRARNKREGIFIGIPTGLAVFDQDGYGVQPGELFTVIGKSGLGKSWLLGELTVNAYLNGAKILYLSPEMSTLDTELRVDCIMMHKQGVDGVSHRGLLGGSEQMVDTYRRWASGLPQDNRWVTVDSDRQGGFTVGSIYDLVTAHQPDILAIDGFHLLAGSRSGQGWENIKHNADGLKAMALLKKLSIYNVMQAQRSVGIHENPTAEQIAYGYSLYEASDKVIAIGGVRGYPDRRTLKVLKYRNAITPIFRINISFRVDEGIIAQTGVEEFEDATEDDI